MEEQMRERECINFLFFIEIKIKQHNKYNHLPEDKKEEESERERESTQRWAKAKAMSKNGLKENN